MTSPEPRDSPRTPAVYSERDAENTIVKPARGPRSNGGVRSSTAASVTLANLRRSPEGAEDVFEPTVVLDVDLAEPIPSIYQVSESGRQYRRALSLVRLHSYALGIVDIDIGASGLPAGAHAAAIWSTLDGAINAHLAADGLAPLSALPLDGITGQGIPACIETRARVVRDSPSITVVIATRERPDTLAECLSSVLASDYPDFDVIVVDNAPSSTATRELVERRFRDAPVRYVREDIPGLATAHNRGLADVTAPVVAFTDDDVIVDSSWLSHVAAAFATGDDVGCVAGMIFPHELETPAQGWLEQFGGYSKGFRRMIFDVGNNKAPSILYPYAAGTFGSGANMSFRTAILREIGGFDPAMGAGSPAPGGDDLAAFFDVIAAGYALVYEPSALVWHRHRRDYRALRNTAFTYGLGLTAYLTKIVFDRPSRARGLLRRLAPGLAHGLSPNSPKNNGKRADYPAELTWRERYGMLVGPFAYARGRWKRRRLYPAHPSRAVPKA
jgi:O-antigen biosynthesis protein